MRSFGGITYFRLCDERYVYCFYISLSSIKLTPSSISTSFSSEMVCYTLGISWLVSFLFPILVTFLLYHNLWGFCSQVFHIGFYSSYTAIFYGVYIVPVIIQSTRVCFLAEYMRSSGLVGVE